MAKGEFKKQFIAFTCLSMICINFLSINNVSATTLKEYEDKLAQYKSEVNNANNQINSNNQQATAAKNEISNIQTQIKNIGAEIETKTQEITEYNQEIKDKGAETKEVFEYLQIAKSENLYLEYAFGAETTTDLIYRLAVIEQITKHNETKTTELQTMIADNEQRKIDLATKEVELNERQKELNQKLVTLGNEKQELNAVSASAAQQVKIYEDIVKAYKELGCKSNDVIGVDCAVASSAGSFRRPTTVGYVSSGFGMRWGSLHRGYDVTVNQRLYNPYTTKIYPVANGRITSKWIDGSGALVLTIEHYDTINKTYFTSLYAHMSSYAPNLYVGKTVTSNDYIGYMGNTGFSTGPHLHLEVIPCRMWNSSDKNCYKWDDYVKYVQKLYNNGFKGPGQYIYFPSSWTSR